MEKNFSAFREKRKKLSQKVNKVYLNIKLKSKTNEIEELNTKMWNYRNILEVSKMSSLQCQSNDRSRIRSVDDSDPMA